MIIPEENHPGHSLLFLSELPPDEALEAWQNQLMADLFSHRKDGVLIHGGFIGSDLQDHGVGTIVSLLALALASSIDSVLAENNGDERLQPIDEVMTEQIADTEAYLVRDVVTDIVEQIKTRYGPTLIAWEEDRRQQEADEEQ